MLQLRKSQDNHLVAECYEKELGEIGGHTAHELLHTEYQESASDLRADARLPRRKIVRPSSACLFAWVRVASFGARRLCSNN